MVPIGKIMFHSPEIVNRESCDPGVFSNYHHQNPGGFRL